MQLIQLQFTQNKAWSESILMKASVYPSSDKLIYRIDNLCKNNVCKIHLSRATHFFPIDIDYFYSSENNMIATQEPN